METGHEVVTEITRRAAEVGVRVWLHARDLDGPARLEIDGSERVVTASVFKVPVALELARQGVAGTVDLAEQVTVEPGSGPASPFGLATYLHPVTMAWQDLATLMIGVSDNVATDLVMGKVGIPAIAATLAKLGFTHTQVPHDCEGIFQTIREDLGVDDYEDDEEALAHLTVPQILALRALQPEHTCSSTPEETTRLLGMIWRDEAGPPAACAIARTWFANQVWPHRLRSGFREDGIQVSGKTGTLPLVRNEVGVVEYPDGGRYAVAVFTRAEDARAQAPERDALIGFAGARAVEWLRA